MQTVLRGGSTSYSATLSPTGCFTGPLTLNVSALPPYATLFRSPNPATGPSTLAVTTSASTPTGTSTLTITGVSGTLTHTTTVTLVLNTHPDFTHAATPASQTVLQGGSTSYSATLSPTGGFTSPVTLNVSGLPTGATGPFTPNPATGPSTLPATTSATP